MAAQRKGGYTRASDGKFSKTSGGGKKAAPKKATRRSRKAIGAALKKKTGKTATAAQVRKRRSELAIAALRKKGVKIPAGSLNKVKNLRKGQTVKLADGTTIRRTADNSYQVVKPKKAKK